MTELSDTLFNVHNSRLLTVDIVITVFIETLNKSQCKSNRQLGLAVSIKLYDRHDGALRCSLLRTVSFFTPELIHVKRGTTPTNMT